MNAFGNIIKATSGINFIITDSAISSGITERSISDMFESMAVDLMDSSLLMVSVTAEHYYDLERDIENEVALFEAIVNIAVKQYGLSNNFIVWSPYHLSKHSNDFMADYGNRIVVVKGLDDTILAKTLSIN